MMHMNNLERELMSFCKKKKKKALAKWLQNKFLPV